MSADDGLCEVCRLELGGKEHKLVFNSLDPHGAYGIGMHKECFLGMTALKRKAFIYTVGKVIQGQMKEIRRKSHE